MSTCVDETGAAVDWWFWYKHPRWADVHHSVDVGDGLGSSYVFTTSANGTWQLGGATVDQNTSLLGRQLEGVYNGSVPNYAFYNDQLPDGGYSSSYGHSKGFLGFGNGASASAFWVRCALARLRVQLGQPPHARRPTRAGAAQHP